MSATFRGDIQQAAEDFARAMRERDREAADALTRSYAEVRRRLAAQYDDLLAEIGRQRLSGAEVEHALANRFSRVATLLRQADEELLAWSSEASATIVAEQRRAIEQAQADQAKLSRITMGEPPPGITATFNRIPTGALSDLVGVLADGSPLADLLDVYGKLASGQIKDALITGLARGLHPFEIARNMRGAMDGNAVRALTVARTEALRAYRESSLRFFKANSDLIDGWLWWSARDETTCPVCWAMHGSRHSIDEHFGSHPNCRCTMLPVTKTWKELGFGDVPNDGALTVPDGEHLFRRQPTSVQRAILGRAKYKAWQAGEIDLADVVNARNDPRWGLVRSEASLADAKARNQAKQPPAPKPKAARKPRAKKVAVDPLRGTEGHKAARAIEQQIRRQTFESAAAYAEDGTRLLFKDGQQYSVTFTDAETVRVRDSIFTHNHPDGHNYPTSDPRHRGNSFSRDDLEYALAANLREIRAVTPVDTYIMRRPAAGWPSDRMLKTEFATADQETRAAFMAALQGGTMTIEQAEATHWHNVWRIVSHRLGLDYEQRIGE